MTAPEPAPRPLGAAAARLEGFSETLDRLVANERVLAAAAAVRIGLVDELRRQWEELSGASWTADRGGMRSRDLRAQIAAAVTQAERTVESLIEHARVLVHELPRTLAALGEGRFSERHARTLAELAGPLDAEARRALESQALPHAEALTAAKFARKVAMLRERLRPEDAETRHEDALAEREVVVTPARDGMAHLYAYLPAVEARGIDDYLDRIARSLQSETESRTRAQLRADVLRDLVLDGRALVPGDAGEPLQEIERPRGIVPTVHVTVPVLSLVGAGSAPAHLAGHGPIDAGTARRIAGVATGFSRILTHPETGAMISFGAERYRVPVELRRYLLHRDGTCRFVGCNRAAVHCDIDHTVAWEHGGTTDSGNLAHLCRGHHRLKHATAWKIEQPPGDSGEVVWTSPAGKRYSTVPDVATSDVATIGGLGLRTQPQQDWLANDDAAYDDDDPPPF